MTFNMAASLTSFQSVICALHAGLLRRAFLPTCSSLNSLQTRFKNSKPRIRDAKVQTDVNKKYIPKKKRRQATVTNVASVEQSTIIAEKPVDNVWVRKFYPNPRFSIEEALNRHKSLAQPAMLDNMEGLVYLNMKLDFSTKKQTKFMKNIRSTVVLPHLFPWGPPPSILVFCKAEEHVNLALSLGAKHAGPPAEVVKMIQSGILNLKDFHHFLATADCAGEILPARSHLKDKYPQKAKGNISTDLNEMWNLFYTGYTYESQKLTEAVGKLQVPIGQLKQPSSELISNFEAYMKSVCQHRSIALGPFILDMTLIAPPSPEEFIVAVEDYVPGYQNEEIDSDEEELAEKQE